MKAIFYGFAIIGCTLGFLALACLLEMVFNALLKFCPPVRKWWDNYISELEGNRDDE